MRMITLEIQLQTLCNAENKRDFFLLEEQKIEHDNIACNVFGISTNELKLKTRKQRIVKARQLCMWYLFHKTTMSLEFIGNKYGGKNHATVIHAVRVVDDLIQTKDAEYYPLIQEFKILTNYENTPFTKRKKKGGFTEN